MISIVIFWIGVVTILINAYVAWFHPGEDNHGVTALPFSLFLASAVAKYIGL